MKYFIVVVLCLVATQLIEAKPKAEGLDKVLDDTKKVIQEVETTLSNKNTQEGEKVTKVVKITSDQFKTAVDNIVTQLNTNLASNQKAIQGKIDEAKNKLSEVSKQIQEFTKLDVKKQGEQLQAVVTKNLDDAFKAVKNLDKDDTIKKPINDFLNQLIEFANDTKKVLEKK